VATDDSGVIGWARLFPWKQRGIDVVEDLVYVDPVHHSRGIGRALLTELITQAKGLGYRTIVATVATDNRSGLQLHAKLGFETVGTIRNAANKFDRWMDITLVQRSLE
jgi:phosphinothricin acetyltransferase